MPVPADNVIRLAYDGAGITGPFTTPYFLANADLKVLKVTIATGAQEEFAIGADFNVTGAGDENGGELTLVSSLSSDFRLVIINEAVDSQEAKYPANDSFPSLTHQGIVDRRTMVSQRMRDLIDRSLRQPDGDTDAIAELPAKVTRAGKFLSFNVTTGDPEVSSSITGTPVASFWEAILALTTAAASRTALAVVGLVELAASGGSALVGFIAAGAGAVLRTLQSKLRDRVSVKDFGAVGDGVANDTAAMQAAHDTGKLIYYPAGGYLFSTISFAAGGIIGDGTGLTTLLSDDDTSANLISFTGTGGAGAVPLFRDFKIESGATKAAGAGLYFEATSAELSYPHVDNILVFNVPRSVDFNKVSKFSLTNSRLLNYTDAGVAVSNTNDVDSGDSVIANNFINTGQASGNRYGIFQKSSGGLKIIGNKILGGTGGYVLHYAEDTQSGPLLIVGNSIENVAGVAIYFAHTAPFTGVFGGIVISGNEIAVCDHGIGAEVDAAITEINISGNYISLNNTTGDNIQLNDASDFYIGGNTLIGGDTAIAIATNCSNGKIGHNTYADQDTAAISNSSSTVLVATDEQSGSVHVTHSTAFADLFHGTAAVVFATEFKTVPTVYCNPTGAAGVAGGFSAYATGISTTGFTYNVVGVSSGATNDNLWTARGVL